MHCIVLHIFIFAFFISFIAFKKRKEKLKFFEKYKNIVCMCILVLVYLWMAIKKVSLLCISSSLDKYCHAQLSNVRFMAHYKICMIWLIFYHSYLYHSF